MPGPAPRPTSPATPEPGSTLDRALQAAVGKQHVLVVEGADDRAFFEALLTRVDPAWPGRLGVVHADGRGRALRWTQSGGPFAQALCYVDRDAWTQAEVAQRQAAHGRLFVTDGWCIENLVVVLSSIGHFGETLRAKLAQDRDAWVRAGSFGWVWQRWQDEITAMVDGQSFAMPGHLDLRSGDALHAGLTARLGAAHQGPVGELVGRWERRLDTMLQLTEAEQWRQAVHGKKYMRDQLKSRLAKERPKGEDEHAWLAGVVNAHRDHSLSSLLAALGL